LILQSTFHNLCSVCLQSYSKRVANARSDKYHSNILKRGKVSDGKEVKPDSCNLISDVLDRDRKPF
jgi:hypothetical protein